MALLDKTNNILSCIQMEQNGADISGKSHHIQVQKQRILIYGYQLQHDIHDDLPYIRCHFSENKEVITLLHNIMLFGMY